MGHNSTSGFQTTLHLHLWLADCAIVSEHWSDMGLQWLLDEGGSNGSADGGGEGNADGGGKGCGEPVLGPHDAKSLEPMAVRTR